VAGLDVRSPDGAGAAQPHVPFDWLPAAGTLMLISGLITMAVIGLAPGRALRVGRATLIQLKARSWS
jgi:lactate permease